MYIGKRLKDRHSIMWVKMKYRIIDGEITDPKDVWGIGEIRNPKRYICLPSNDK